MCSKMEEFTYVNFAEDIYKIRRRFAWTQKRFAEELGVDVYTISRWENGHHTPNFRTGKIIDDFCKAHGIHFDVYRYVNLE